MAPTMQPRGLQNDKNTAPKRDLILGAIPGSTFTIFRPPKRAQNGTQNRSKSGLGAPGPPRGLQGALPEPFWAHFGPWEPRKPRKIRGSSAGGELKPRKISMKSINFRSQKVKGEISQSRPALRGDLLELPQSLIGASWRPFSTAKIKRRHSDSFPAFEFPRAVCSLAGFWALAPYWIRPASIKDAARCRERSLAK